MSERSLSEIIGMQFYPWNGPTVDDLLAWLHENYVLDGTEHTVLLAMGWHGLRRRAEARFMVRLNGLEPGSRCFSGHTTLLAALEAAVRAVDQQSSSGAAVHAATSSEAPRQSPGVATSQSGPT